VAFSSFYYSYYYRYFPLFREAFFLRDDVMVHVRHFFDDVRRLEGKRELTFVGVHVRRDDYKPYLLLNHDTLPLRATWYLTAMERMKKMVGQEKDIVFVVTTDEPSWARHNLANVSGVYLSARHYKHISEPFQVRFDFSLLASW